MGLECDHIVMKNDRKRQTWHPFMGNLKTLSPFAARTQSNLRESSEGPPIRMLRLNFEFEMKNQLRQRQQKNHMKGACEPIHADQKHLPSHMNSRKNGG